MASPRPVPFGLRVKNGEKMFGKSSDAMPQPESAIDTTTSSGELIFHVFSALAQFERRLIQERTKAGIAAARARGRKGGRPPMRPNEPKVVLAKRLYCDKTVSLDDICATLKMSKSTLYRYVAMNATEDAGCERRPS